MSTFIFRLPVYTLVSRSDKSVLMLCNENEKCPHLFTDNDLALTYAEGIGVDDQYIAVTVRGRRQLIQFLRAAPKSVTHLLLDPTVRDARPQKAIRVSVSELLSILLQRSGSRDVDLPSCGLRKI